MDDRHIATTGTLSLAALLLFGSATLICVPINLLEGLVPTPFLPLVVIFLYGLDRPSSLPPWMSFAAGLYLDLLLGMALGPWASVFLLMHAAVVWQRSYFAGRDSLVLLTGFGIALGGVLTVYWVEMSVLGGRVMPLWPLAYQGLITALVFAPALLLFRRLIAKQPVTLGGLG
ncbi:MAG: hypothetical protein AAGH41_03690 [Pseudomonadota bacterium]